MREKLITYFSKFAQLTPSEKEAIRSGSRIQSFPRGTVLLREGQVNKEVYFVLQGCIRQYYIIDGEEKTSNFFTEEQWVLSLNSQDQNTPSSFYYDCVEDCTLVVSREEDYNPMYKAFPRFEGISRLILEHEFRHQQVIQTSFITSTAEQRYLNLLQLTSDLVNRVPQYQIASYIGVKPETLSRIRRRLSKKK